MNTTDLSKNWVYKTDVEQWKFVDVWKFVDPNEYGKFVGDCEDYSLTWLALSEGSKWKAVKAILLGKAKFWYVLTNRGEGHAVLQVGEDSYVDNWVREPKSYEYMCAIGHDFKYVINRLGVLVMILKGLRHG